VQSVAHATLTAVTFDTEHRDDGGFVTLGSSASRFTITNAGWYVLNGVVRFAANTTGNRLIFWVKNGDTNDRYGQVLVAAAGSSSATVMASSPVLYLAAGDYIELYAYQDSTVSLDLTLYTAGGTDSAQPYAAIHRLGTPPEAAAFDPATDHNFYDDFVATDFASNDSWSSATATGGTVVQSSESKHPGTIVFSTSTNNAGYAIATLSPIGDSAFTVEQLYFMPTGTDELHFEAYIKCGTLSTVGSPTMYRVGFSTDASTYSHYAFLDLSTTYTLRTKGGGGAADVTLSPSVSANTWHKIRITLTATQIRAYIDGVLAATQSTAANLPTGGFTPMLFAQNLGGTGVNHVLTVDYVRVWGDTPRN
jgi:hypothetical protein